MIKVKFNLRRKEKRNCDTGLETKTFSLASFVIKDWRIKNVWEECLVLRWVTLMKSLWWGRANDVIREMLEEVGSGRRDRWCPILSLKLPLVFQTFYRWRNNQMLRHPLKNHLGGILFWDPKGQNVGNIYAGLLLLMQ